ncbi:MAG TPA: PilZ domain-containing protein, partial [Thermoanaerobaculia bacterium]
MSEPALNLRTAERFLLAPPLAGQFGTQSVAVCDISAKGARFRHAKPLEMGRKSLLKLAVEGRILPVSLEAVIVWTQPDGAVPGQFVSGVRTYGTAEVFQSLIAELQASDRTSRIEELRSTDRFNIAPELVAEYGGRQVLVENLSARGARIEASLPPVRGASASLHFSVPDTQVSVT